MGYFFIEVSLQHLLKQMVSEDKMQWQRFEGDGRIVQRYILELYWENW